MGASFRTEGYLSGQEKQGEHTEMKKQITALLLCAFALAVPMTSYAESAVIVAGGYSVQGPGAGKWERDDHGWWYAQPGGSYISNDWLKWNGRWYHFDEKGYMQTGLIFDNGAYYYLEEDGAMVAGEPREIGGITYHFDASGAGTPEWPYKAITPIPAESEKSDLHKTLDQMCDQILAGIIRDGMSSREKATAIYAWVRGSFRYSGHSATRDWVTEAYQGLRRRHGDCYTYFAVSQALLSRSGIPCIEVIRYTDNDHYWNLMQLEDGWWHFDATPRSAGGYFCLWSDAQMAAYSARHGGCFAFDQALYPRTP